MLTGYAIASARTEPGKRCKPAPPHIIDGLAAPSPRKSEPTLGDQDANASSAMKDYATFDACAISERASAAIAKDFSRAA